MNERDWEILTVGDRITRLMYEQPPLVLPGEPPLPASPPVEPPSQRLIAHDAFQVMQIANGVVTAARVCERTEFHGSLRTVTEVVEIRREGALFDGGQLLPGHGMTCVWQWVPPAKGEARLTGGFIVRRVDGTEERDRCPTAVSPRS